MKSGWNDLDLLRLTRARFCLFFHSFEQIGTMYFLGISRNRRFFYSVSWTIKFVAFDADLMPHTGREEYSSVRRHTLVE